MSILDELERMKQMLDAVAPAPRWPDRIIMGGKIHAEKLGLVMYMSRELMGRLRAAMPEIDRPSILPAPMIGGIELQVASCLPKPVEEWEHGEEAPIRG